MVLGREDPRAPGEKIKWPRRFDDPDTERFIITVDGVDCKIWEPKRPTLPVDKSYYSHKFRKAGLRYELGISVHGSKLVWMSGPHKCGNHPDKSIFRHKGLKDKIREGKRVIADGAYSGFREVSIPNHADDKKLKNFKSRARLRHETFNARIKSFGCLQNTFRHGMKKHKIAFEAVCVIVQYQMDNGTSSLFDV